ncbi:hypothetical protein AGLY_000500 [Aphis glycines]|uniref:Uncharacterized protein n=1 Tax=Aphis glycines TaxID=307491 RepID=A0A6G0U7N0_APHGL|nr:hypothetical protein AGLY_000500 [Aphis glycines]
MFSYLAAVIAYKNTIINRELFTFIYFNLPLYFGLQIQRCCSLSHTPLLAVHLFGQIGINEFFKMQSDCGIGGISCFYKPTTLHIKHVPLRQMPLPHSTSLHRSSEHCATDTIPKTSTSSRAKLVTAVVIIVGIILFRRYLDLKRNRNMSNKTFFMTCGTRRRLTEIPNVLRRVPNFDDLVVISLRHSLITSHRRLRRTRAYASRKHSRQLLSLRLRFKIMKSAI